MNTAMQNDSFADLLPARPALTHADVVNIAPCDMDLSSHALLVAVQQGGVLTPDIAPYRLVVHPYAVHCATHCAWMVFGQHWTRVCEISAEPLFEEFEWAIDCRDRRVRSAGA